MQCKAETPMSPTDLVAVNLEASVLGRRLAHWAFRPFSLVAFIEGREFTMLAPPVADTLVLELGNLLVREVYQHVQIFDWPIFAREHGQEDAAVAIAGACRVRTDGPAEDRDSFDILNAAFRHRLAPTRIGANDLGGLTMVVGQDARLRFGNVLPRQQLLGVKIDNGFAGSIVDPIVDDGEGLPRQRLSRTQGEHFFLGWFVQMDIHEPSRIGDLPGVSEYSHRVRQLVFAQWIERMSGPLGIRAAVRDFQE